MKNHVLVEKTTYKVDEKNKVVVCIMECDLQMHKHPAWCWFTQDFWKRGMPNVSWDGKFIVRAKARCNGTDTFNVETGKRIAESRAKAKAFKTGFKVWRIVANKFNELANSCMSWAQACYTTMGHEHIHIEELTK